VAENMYVISFDNDMVDVAYAEDPIAAVRSYYETQDMYCSPGDPDMREEFSVIVYEVPSDIAEEVAGLLNDLNGDDQSAVFAKVRARHLNIRSTALDVVNTAAGVEAKIGSD
jgi:hypothetical protein